MRWLQLLDDNVEDREVSGRCEAQRASKHSYSLVHYFTGSTCEASKTLYQSGCSLRSRPLQHSCAFKHYCFQYVHCPTTDYWISTSIRTATKIL